MTKQEWIEYQRQLPKIDTHEHLPLEQALLDAPADILDMLLFPYNCDTLRSAGCTDEEWTLLNNKNLPLPQRCELLEKYLPAIRYAAVFRAFSRTMALEFGEEQVDAQSLCRANAKLQEMMKKPFYHDAMDRMNIRGSLDFYSYDAAAYFSDDRLRFVPNVTDMLPQGREDVARLEKAAGVKIYTLEDLLHAVDLMFESYAAAGVRAIKFSSGYWRTLHYAAPDRQLAAQQLEAVLAAQANGDDHNNGRPLLRKCYEEVEALEDCMVHRMLALCERYGFAAVFHVGMHAWNDNDPERTRAHYLRNVIRRYSGVNFVLLHVGIPYFEEAVLMARYYPNVYLDLTWTHICSPRLAREAIHRILEQVPVNKVFAFGGDYMYILALRGHLEVAMENLAIVMSEAVAEGIMDEEQGKEILRSWFFENPNRVYRLEMDA